MTFFVTLVHDNDNDDVHDTYDKKVRIQALQITKKIMVTHMMMMLIELESKSDIFSQQEAG